MRAWIEIDLKYPTAHKISFNAHIEWARKHNQVISPRRVPEDYVNRPVLNPWLVDIMQYFNVLCGRRPVAAMSDYIAPIPIGEIADYVKMKSPPECQQDDFDMLIDLDHIWRDVALRYREQDQAAADRKEKVKKDLNAQKKR